MSEEFVESSYTIYVRYEDSEETSLYADLTFDDFIEKLKHISEDYILCADQKYKEAIYSRGGGKDVYFHYYAIPKRR